MLTFFLSFIIHEWKLGGEGEREEEEGLLRSQSVTYIRKTVIYIMIEEYIHFFSYADWKQGGKRKRIEGKFRLYIYSLTTYVYR